MTEAERPVSAALVASLVARAEAEGIARLTVGAVIGNGGKVLLLLRPEDDFMPGVFELPSGKVEASESLLEALAREVSEETGLTVTGVEAYLGAFDYRSGSGSGKRTRQFNFAVTMAALEPVALTEHDDHIWASVEEEAPVSTAVAKVLAHYRKSGGV